MVAIADEGTLLLHGAPHLTSDLATVLHVLHAGTASA